MEREEIAALSQFKELEESWQSGMQRAIYIYENYQDIYGPWPDDYEGIVEELFRHREEVNMTENVPQYFARVIMKIKNRGYCPNGKYSIDCLVPPEDPIHPNLYGMFGGETNQPRYKDHVFWTNLNMDIW